MSDPHTPEPAALNLNLSSPTWFEQVPAAPCASVSLPVRLGVMTVCTPQACYED